MLLGMFFFFGFLELSLFNGQQINWFAFVFLYFASRERRHKYI